MAQAFEQTALVMTAVICNPEQIATTQTVSISCQAPNNELLLVDWINELVYEMVLFNNYD